jgi:hypothetical protein
MSYSSNILLTLFSKPMLQRLQSESVQINTSKYISLHQLSRLYRRYFVIKLHTWFCLSYFLKTNIQFYCIYQYFMSINSFFNTVSVSRYNTLFRKNCWNVLKWVTGHCNRAAVSRNRYGVKKTVDTHKILINAIKLYVCRYNCKFNS